MFIEIFDNYLKPLFFGLGGWGSGGLIVNLKLTLAAIPLCLVLGTLIALLRASNIGVTNLVLGIYIEVAKSTPLILGMFWFYSLVPMLTSLDINLFEAGTYSIVFFGVPYVAEVVTSGLNAVDKNEIELAEISGMSKLHIAFYIMIPQCFFIMVPVLMSVVISLFKDTSTVFIIGLIELTQSGMTIANYYPEKLPTIYLIIGLGYLIVCSALSSISYCLQARWKKYIPNPI